MTSSNKILDLFGQHMDTLAGTFMLCYGESTGRVRYDETVDAFNRDNSWKLVRSLTQVMNEWPRHLSYEDTSILRNILSKAGYVAVVGGEKLDTDNTLEYYDPNDTEPEPDLDDLLAAEKSDLHEDGTS